MPYQVTEQAAGMGDRHRKVTVARRAVRVARAVGSLVMKRRPRWALKAMAVAVIIPGWADEILLGMAIAGYVVVRYRAEFAAVARSAWESAA